MNTRSSQTVAPGAMQRRFRSSRLPGAFAPLMVLILLSINGNAVASKDSNNTEVSLYRQYCSNTSVAGRTACGHESTDDYVTAWAVCLNTADAQEQSDCFEEAREMRKEAKDECEDVFFAREEICDLIGQDRYDPQYSPDDFVDPESIGFGEDDTAPNPYFPLVAGMKWVYEGDGEVIHVEVLDETMEINGVDCVVVHDVVYETDTDEDDEEGMKSSTEEDGDLPGVPVEDTMDWYAQDEQGNVWYFGEISLNYEEGVITDIDGSWKAGVEGARPGILMPAAPLVGDVYRQEWLLGDAEDMAEVLSLTAEPELSEDNAGDCNPGCLQTLEWTPLEADSYEYKYYRAGIGLVQEANPDDPEETVELVEFSGGAE